MKGFIVFTCLRPVNGLDYDLGGKIYCQYSFSFAIYFHILCYSFSSLNWVYSQRVISIWSASHSAFVERCKVVEGIGEVLL